MWTNADGACGSARARCATSSASATQCRPHTRRQGGCAARSVLPVLWRRRAHTHTTCACVCCCRQHLGPLQETNQFRTLRTSSLSLSSSPSSSLSPSSPSPSSSSCATPSSCSQRRSMPSVGRRPLRALRPRWPAVPVPGVDDEATEGAEDASGPDAGAGACACACPTPPPTPAAPARLPAASRRAVLPAAAGCGGLRVGASPSPYTCLTSSAVTRELPDELAGLPHLQARPGSTTRRAGTRSRQPGREGQQRSMG